MWAAEAQTSLCFGTASLGLLLACIEVEEKEGEDKKLDL